jgi:pyruvate/2-oxoglutarate dehydrogenase complex dihydrolipoamide acyltransferase (E2) component
MELRLPELSEGSSEAVITVWHADENSRVVKGQDLVEVSTDKATFDIPSPCSGVLMGIARKKGEAAKTDEVLAEIREA